MKKFLYVLIITAFLLLNNFAFAAYKPVTFMERTFHLKRTAFDKNYGMINIYTAFPGYEQDKYFDELYLSYDKFNYPVKNIYNDYIKHYSDIIKTIKVSETRVAVSSIEEGNNYLLYTVNLFEPNSISGTNRMQIFIKASLDTDVKTLDDKYFDAFFAAEFPTVFDNDGNPAPKLYGMNFDNTDFVLKYSKTKRGHFVNYYLPEKETFTDYTKTVRVNYRPTGIKAEKLVKQIIQSKQGADGFKILTDKYENDAYIFSYIIDTVDLNKKQMFTSYHIFKIMPYKRGVKTIELITLIPQDKTTAKKIKNFETKYNEILMTYEIPQPVKDIFGTMPNDFEDPYYEIYKGIQK